MKAYLKDVLEFAAITLCVHILLVRKLMFPFY